jgi:hypothetical protein
MVRPLHDRLLLSANTPNKMLAVITAVTRDADAAAPNGTAIDRWPT